MSGRSDAMGGAWLCEQLWMLGVAIASMAIKLEAGDGLTWFSEFKGEAHALYLSEK